MTELINQLYYMVDDWVGQYDFQSGDVKELERRKMALQDEMVRCIGEGGEDMMEALSNLNLKLEDIHDQSLFRAAMQLGAEIAQPRRSPWAAAVLSDRGTSGSGQKGGTRPEPHAPEG